MEFAVPKSEYKARANGLLNEYNPATMFQRIDSALSKKNFGERAIAKERDGYVDLMLHGGPPVSLERLLQRRKEIDRMYGTIKKSDMVVITLGLVQSWYDHEDQLYLNRMPGLLAMRTYPGRYSSRILDVETSYAFLSLVVEKLISAGVQKILVTVSPVPLQKSFNGMDAAILNCYSKSVLRTCAHRLYMDFSQVDYFPSYEIVLSAGMHAFMDDNVHVNKGVVDNIIKYMSELYVTESSPG
jgi:hypothetical protein